VLFKCGTQEYVKSLKCKCNATLRIGLESRKEKKIEKDDKARSLDF